MKRAIVFLCGLLLAMPADAVPAKKKRPRRTPPRHELKVTPSQAIEERVELEIRKADAVLAHLDAINLFDSPYVISAFYYREGFLTRYPEDKQDADPARRIISHVARGLTPQLKVRFVALLHELYGPRSHGPEAALHAPVPLAPPNKRRLRRTHPTAVDLFAPEGTPVRSAAAGVVLLAESGWTETDAFSTSSHAGGNTVILFDPASDRFYRYCHLAGVDVIPGAVVEAGQRLGAVGHTGLNASRDGHGGHLHFEVNQYDGESIRPFPYKEVWALLSHAA